MTHSHTLRVPPPVAEALHLFTPVGDVTTPLDDEPFEPDIAHWEHAIRAALTGS